MGLRLPRHRSCSLQMGHLSGFPSRHPSLMPHHCPCAARLPWYLHLLRNREKSSGSPFFPKATFLEGSPSLNKATLRSSRREEI